ncbi:MAG: YtxH domain-containing protein [Porticoccaceae bacterium]|nr:YtxH domain-containing protein [Porticoccaceae bacterium]
MSLLKKPTVIAALLSAVIVGLSACGGDESTSDVNKAEEIRGVVKDVSSKAKETASEMTAKAKETASEATAKVKETASEATDKVKETASDVTAKAKQTASNTVQSIENKIKVPANDNNSDSE